MLQDATRIESGLTFHWLDHNGRRLRETIRTQCTLYARSDELIVLFPTVRRRGSMILQSFAGLATTVGAVLVDRVEVDWRLAAAAIGGLWLLAFAYASGQSPDPESLESSSIDMLEAEGRLARLYLRNAVEVVPPERVRLTFTKPARINLGDRIAVLEVTESSFEHATSITSTS